MRAVLLILLFLCPVCVPSQQIKPRQIFIHQATDEQLEFIDRAMDAARVYNDIDPDLMAGAWNTFFSDYADGKVNLHMAAIIDRETSKIKELSKRFDKMKRAEEWPK